MKLAEYLEKNGITRTAFGLKIGRSTATISRLANGVQRPDLATLLAISKETGGLVAASDFADATPANGKRENAA